MADIANIKLAGGTVYWGTDYLGDISEDGITVSVNGNVVDVFTAESGPNTPVKSFSSGDSVEVVVTFRELDKFIIAKSLGTVTETGTNSTNGEAGVLSAGREAGFVIPAKPLTLYPHFVNETTGQPLGDNVSNLWAFRVHKARPNTEADFLFSPSEPVAPEIAFVGQYDKTKANGNRLWRWGSGISPEA